jgi:hypothetical protein
MSRAWSTAGSGTYISGYSGCSGYRVYSGCGNSGSGCTYYRVLCLSRYRGGHTLYMAVVVVVAIGVVGAIGYSVSSAINELNVE